MIPEPLNQEEQALILKMAREALEAGVRQAELPPLDFDSLPERFRELGATFVTLTECGELRGCIGTLEACQPLAEDVRERAISAALYDYRFPPVSPDELPEIEIEVSVLTPMIPISYETPADLLKAVRPHIDGVMIRDGRRRATFLPQVWEKVPDPGDFFDHLCYKMGAEPGLWQKKKLEVSVYQVQEIRPAESQSSQ